MTNEEKPLYYIDYYLPNSLKKRRVCTQSEELQQKRLNDYVADGIVIAASGIVEDTPKFWLQWYSPSRKLFQSPYPYSESIASERRDKLRAHGVNAWLVPA